MDYHSSKQKQHIPSQIVFNHEADQRFIYIWNVCVMAICILCGHTVIASYGFKFYLLAMWPLMERKTGEKVSGQTIKSTNSDVQLLIEAESSQILFSVSAPLVSM